MASAIPYAHRLQIIKQKEGGRSLKEISTDLPYSYDGVSKIWRLYQSEGLSGLGTGYHRCGRKKVYTDEAIGSTLSDMLAANDQLGAPYLRSKLLASKVFDAVPHERTIQRWMRAQGYSLPKGRRPSSKKGYATEAHQGWQVDGKEQVALSDGQQSCWLSIADEASAGFLKGYVFKGEKKYDAAN